MEDHYCRQNLEEWAQGGDASAMCQLGDEYRQAGDFVSAHAWYLKAAKVGWRDAMRRVAEDCYWGWGTEENMAEALDWTKKAARGGEIAGCCLLEQMRKGKGKEAAEHSLRQILDRSVKDIYETHLLKRIIKLGSRRFDEYTPQYEATWERRRLWNGICSKNGGMQG